MNFFILRSTTTLLILCFIISLKIECFALEKILKYQENEALKKALLKAHLASYALLLILIPLGLFIPELVNLVGLSLVHLF